MAKKYYIDEPAMTKNNLECQSERIMRNFGHAVR